MKDLPTSQKVAKNGNAGKGSGLLAKPSRSETASSEKNAIEHIRNLSRKLADAQTLADARLQEIIILSKLVIELREKVESKADVPNAKPKRKQDFRFWGVASYLAGRPRDRIKKDVSVIRNSPFFDSAWYLKRYADVQKSGLDPALHYLRFGAKEGRDPGPNFSTLEYMKKHPELENSGENPLLNYIKTNV